MHVIFVSIYHFFQRHKVLMYLLMAVSFVVFLFFGLKVRYEEDITKLLPSPSMQTEVALFDISLKDKIFVQVTSADKKLSVEELSERTDEFVDLLLKKDSTSGCIANVLYKLEPEMALNALDFVMAHVPSFVDTSAYARMLSSLDPDTVAVQMKENADMIHEDITGDVTDMINIDPLNLKAAVLGDLLENAMGSYNIIDGYLFCPDSTVAICYLTPAARSTDSQFASKLTNMLFDITEEFEAMHPEIKVMFHGNLIGGDSNASRIKADLLVTVGISLIVILILLGLCFKSFSFLWKMLMPILYGTAFSLACIYWFKGSMSLMALGLGAIILGVAISYCLHVLIHHFFVGDPEKLLKDEATPVFLGCLTTIGAFCSLLFTESELLHDFGIFGSLALAGSTLFALVFLPHFMPNCKADKDGSMFHYIMRINSLPFDRKIWFLALMVVIIVVGVVFSPKVEFDDDIRHLDYNSPQEIESESLFNEKNNDGFAHQFFAAVSNDFDEALKINKSMIMKLDSLKTKGLVHSYSRLVPSLFISQEEQEQRIHAWNEFWTPQRKDEVMTMLKVNAKLCNLDVFPFIDFQAFQNVIEAEYEPASLLESGVIPDNLLCNFIELNGKGQYMVFTDVAMRFEDKDLVTEALGKNQNMFILEPFYYYRDLIKDIQNDFNIAVWISSLFVLLILLISFRNFMTALISFIPMMLSWFMVQGYMALIGLEFNLINIIISTFIFGIGVDYSIFIMEGLLSEAKSGSKDVLTWHKVAIFFSAVILIIVISSLLFAVHPSIKSIGLSTLIGMASTIMISYSLQPFVFRQLMKIPAIKRSVLTSKHGKNK